MKSTALMLVGVLVLGGAAGGCKSDEPEPVGRGDFAAEAAELFCNSLGECCRAGSFAIDLAACKTETAANFEANWSQLGSNVTYDDVAAGECLAEIGPHLKCGEIKGQAANGACARVFVGKLAPGAACRSSLECSRSEGQLVSCTAEGDGPSTCAPRSSTPAPHGKLGEACSTTCADDGDDAITCSGAAAAGPGAPPDATCYKSDGLYCSFGADVKCQPLVDVGQACNGFDACRGRAFCLMSAVTSGGTCTAPQANGATCTSSSQCQSGACSNEEDGEGECVADVVEQEDCANPDFD